MTNLIRPWPAWGNAVYCFAAVAVLVFAIIGTHSKTEIVTLSWLAGAYTVAGVMFAGDAIRRKRADR